ncbi:unnamed protein product [Orchesella dallaii]|uniref:BESS domain-containing protein n=1 Tax=Orchesella dallaii TaxID=48710 RepID=A0ABP1QY78_9HEXA
MWSKLRNQYAAHQRKLQSPSGSAAKRRPYYRHEESMKFIKDSAPEESTYSNIAADSDDIRVELDEDEDNNGPANQQLDNEPRAQENKENLVERDLESQEHRSHSKFKGKRKLDPFDQEVLKFLKSDDDDEFKFFGDFVSKKLRELNKKDEEKCSQIQLDIHYILHCAFTGKEFKNQ